MDEIAAYNKERWEELARAGIGYSLPALDLTTESARQMVDANGVMGDVAGKDVLCLASGGGQQSAAFGVLGARVTVFDLCETQLERDRQAAAHYGAEIRTEQGDMRDLSRFDDRSFDVVWHAHSINFVPGPMTVFDEVARVVRHGGLYHVNTHNAFVHGLDDVDWNGDGYSLRQTYVDGAEVFYRDPLWGVKGPDGVERRIAGPHEYRHGLGTIANGLIERGFVLLWVGEGERGSADAEPGTWDHLMSIAPPYWTFWGRYLPDVMARAAAG